MSIADGMKDIVDDIEHSRAERINDVGDMRTERINRIGEIRSAVQDMIHSFNSERKHNAADVHRMIHSFNSERMAMARETQDMLGGFADERVARAIELTYMLDGFKKQRVPFQEDLAEAHGIWQSHIMRNEHPGARHGLKTVHKATKATRKESEKPEQAADQDLKEKVLKVINNSPKGITLTKAGKTIGVEWRTLIRPAKELLEIGDIRKKDTYYFPT
jgi:hypothetical protein